MAALDSGTHNGKGGRERRRFFRKNVVERQLVTVDLGGGLSGILVDVSEDGIAIQPFLPLRVGTALPFEFDLPRGCGRVSGDGVVMWTGRTGRAGIRFARLSQRSWNHLERWLKDAQDPLGEMLQTLKMQREQGMAAIADVSHDPAEELDADTALSLITERACTITRASGAALILASPAGFSCRASVGTAPDVGATVQLDSSLTGECLRMGVTIKCGDAMTDGRVNAGAREQLNIRSILAVPVLLKKQVIGALEVLSPRPEAFTERDVRRLEQLAEIAAHSEDFTMETTAG